MKRRDFLRLALGAGTFFSLWGAPGLRFFKDPGPPLCSDDVSSARFMATGDIMAHQSLLGYAKVSETGYDFKQFFKYVRPIFLEADVLFGNLECPLGGSASGYTGYPNFNAPDELAEALAWAGYNVLSVANNHSLDRNWSGLIRTTEVLRANKLLYAGAFQSAEDRAAPRLVKTIGPALGFLAYTYGVNGPHKNPENEPWRLNFIDAPLIVQDLEDLRPQCDFSIVSLHFGPEYHRRPSREQEALVGKILAAGADLVIGHHPHVLQPIWEGEATRGRQKAIFSLGNFLSTQAQPFADHGAIFDCQLGFDDQGRKVWGPVTLHSTRCLKCREDGQRVFRIVPSRGAASAPEAFGLTAGEAEKLGLEKDEMAFHLLNVDGPASPGGKTR